MKSRFDFYEIVKIYPKDTNSEIRRGSEGVVLGRAQGESGVWTYAVDVYGQKDSGHWFYEEELKPTGRMDKRESFYDGAVIRVRVDPETGEGDIVE